MALSSLGTYGCCTWFQLKEQILTMLHVSNCCTTEVDEKFSPDLSRHQDEVCYSNCTCSKSVTLPICAPSLKSFALLSQIKLHLDHDTYQRCQDKLTDFNLSKEDGFRWCANVSLPSYSGEG